MNIISVPDAAWSKQEVSLEDTPYRLEFIWNSRASAWVMNMYDADDVMLLAGIKLCMGTELIRRFRYRDIPPGAMELISTSYPYVEPTRTSLPEGIVNLAYTTEAEYDALR